ncbi:MAG: DUF1629 domain-containing protein [Hyphomicrobium sp.]
MEAYMVELDLESVTQAQANRSAAQFDPFGSWLLKTGGGGKVPEEWLQHWPSRASGPPSETEPTAWINAAGYSVRPEVKDVIETLAPGVHQFVPLKLEAGPNAQRKEYPYYSIHVADRADDVIVEKSEVEWLEMSGLRYWSRRFGGVIALPQPSIVGKHIWWNRRCNILLVSGELHDRLVQKGLTTGLKFQKQIVE